MFVVVVFFFVSIVCVYMHIVPVDPFRIETHKSVIFTWAVKLWVVHDLAPKTTFCAVLPVDVNCDTTFTIPMNFHEIS